MENKEVYLEPEVTEIKFLDPKNSVIAFFIGKGLIILAALLVWVFDLSQLNFIILATAIIVLYAVILFFMLKRMAIRQIEQTKIRTIEKPVIREVPVEKRVFIEKPVIKEVYLPIKEKRVKLDIPKYNFVASIQTKTYHTRNCRLGKLIKRKYKLSNNSEAFFKRKRFKACKVCIKKTKKI